MKPIVIAFAAGLGLSFVGFAQAGDFMRPRPVGTGPLWSNDGPYYIVPREQGFNIECGRPRVPLSAYEPMPNSFYPDALGSRCMKGAYTYLPTFPPRCHVGYVKRSRGWVRMRDCS